MLENLYSEATNNIEVEVIPLFVPKQEQFPGQYLYTYNISITNHSDEVCQLLRRHWIIIDGDGNRQEVEGVGVIREQPHLNPGECYQYSSYCPIPTPTGNMRGFFVFINSKNQEFRVNVPVFFLRKDAILQ